MITLNTILYGNFCDERHQEFVSSFNHPLISKRLVTLSGVNPEYFEKVDGVEYISVDDKRFEVADFFEINNYHVYDCYLMPMLTGIYGCNTEYFMHVAIDCSRDSIIYGDGIYIEDDFFTDSLEELKKPECATTMIKWARHEVGPAEESSSKSILGVDWSSDKFYCRANSTDQMFLGRSEVLKEICYNHPQSYGDLIYRGPEYGKFSFEKRMVNFHVATSSYNAVHKGGSFYLHRPESIWSEE